MTARFLLGEQMRPDRCVERRRSVGSVSEEVDFSWRRVARLFKPHRRQTVGVTLLVLLGAVIGIVNPLLIQRVFDQGLFPEGGGGPSYPNM